VGTVDICRSRILAIVVLSEPILHYVADGTAVQCSAMQCSNGAYLKRLALRQRFLKNCALSHPDHTNTTETRCALHLAPGVACTFLWLVGACETAAALLQKQMQRHPTPACKSAHARNAGLSACACVRIPACPSTCSSATPNLGAVQQPIWQMVWKHMRKDTWAPHLTGQRTVSSQKVTCGCLYHTSSAKHRALVAQTCH
jgi:uncharacterized heparinase superfamily protein